MSRGEVSSSETSQGTVRAFHEGSLQGAERDYRLLLESAPIGIQENDLSGTITYSNAEHCRMHGYQPGEMVGMAIWDTLYDSDEKENLKRYFADLVKQKPDPVIYFGRGKTKSGALVEVKVDWRYNYDTEGKLIGFTSAITDITARRKAEETIRKLSRAVEQSPNAIFITDLAGQIEYVNSKFTQLTGYSAAEAIGESPRILRSGLMPPEFFADLWQTIKAGREWQGDVCDLHKNGHLFWAHERIAPVKNEAGQVTHFVANYEDVTQRHMEDHNIRAALEEARAADATKNLFLSSVSHELRTPLNAILGFAQVLEGALGGVALDEQKVCVDHILDGGHHLLALIDDILDLTKIEANIFELSKERINLVSVIENALAMVRTMALKRNIHLITQLPDENLCIQADPTRMKQVLLNLLSNAIKYNRENGSVTVVLERDGVDGIRVQIIDTGRGIPTERQGELFTAFSRLGVEDTGIEGTGIGLVICKKLVEMMGGVIGFRSERDRGSIFWVTFNICKGGEEPNEPLFDDIQQQVPVSTETSAKILYIEDNSANQRLMELIVSNIEGVSLKIAGSGEAGIQRAVQDQPDLILMDINLPGVDGYDALKQLKNRKETRGIPVIAISAAATKRDKNRGLKAGFVRYLTKPVDVADVINALKSVLWEA